MNRSLCRAAAGDLKTDSEVTMQQGDKTRNGSRFCIFISFL